MWDFDLILDNLEVVPKEFHGLYAKGADGKFALNEVVAKKVDNTGLVSALEKERKANRDLTTASKAWAKYGKPEDLDQKLADLEKGQGDKDVAKTNYEKLKQSLMDQHQKDLAERDQMVTKMRGTLDSHLIDAQAATAIAGLKGSPTLLLPHVRNSVKVFEDNGKFIARVIDAEGEPRGDGKGGFMTVDGFVAELRKHPDFARAFEPTGAAGSGMQPGKGGMPSGGAKSSHDKLVSGLSQLTNQ